MAVLAYYANVPPSEFDEMLDDDVSALADQVKRLRSAERDEAVEMMIQQARLIAQATG